MSTKLIQASIIALFLSPSTQVWARDLDTNQRLDFDFSVVNAMSSTETLPYYLTANQYGVLSPSGSQVYLRAAALYTMQHRDIHLEAGIDGINYAIVEKDYYGHHPQLQQCYIKTSWKNFYITLGQKEEYGVLVNGQMSSGNMLFSGNARPAAGIRFGTEDFIKMRIMANKMEGYFDASYGKLTDASYNLENYRRYESIFSTDGAKDVRQHHLVQGAWIHQSRLMLRTSTDYCLYGTVGLEHAAMYGGKVDHIKQNGFSNFIIVSLGAKGKGHNGLPALFNHLLAYDMRADLKKRKWSTAVYRQLYADDLDGGVFRSGWDGLSGIEVRFNKFHWMNHLVFEYLQSTKQGGVVYANDTYWYDGQQKVHSTAGNSNIYHDEWYGGWAHYGMALGNPLITSPVYNEDHYSDFEMNMVKAFHFACEGKITDNFSYQLKYHHSKTWGTPFAPLASTRQNHSGNLSLLYGWGYWTIQGRVCYDHGTIMGNQWGGLLSVTRHFQLRNW